MIEYVLNYTFTYAKKYGVKLENEHWYDHYQIQSRQVMEIRLLCYGINKCQPTEIFPNDKPDIIL